MGDSLRATVKPLYMVERNTGQRKNEQRFSSTIYLHMNILLHSLLHSYNLSPFFRLSFLPQ